MKLWSLRASTVLRLFFGFICFQSIASDCLFPKLDFPNGTVRYQSPEDANDTFAEDLYVLQFECSPGFYRVGPKFIQCVDEEWTDEVPFCAMLECSDPPDIENAEYVIKTGTSQYHAPTLGSSAEYACKFGYQLNDTEAYSLACTLNKTSKMAIWSGKQPVCKKKTSCPDPGVSNNGTRKGVGFFAGNYIHYSCNDGFELIGRRVIRCLPWGTWTSGRPLCKPSGIHCDLPPLIPHGLVQGKKEGDYFLPYEEAHVLCEPGYACRGAEIVFCENDGTWESEFGECVEISCDLPPPVLNGSIPELLTTNLTSFPHKFEITYACDKGYRLVEGDSWRICEKGGWSGREPKCEVTKCPDPGIPEHGRKIGDTYTVGSKVLFGCFDGYELLGSVERYCLSNGQWSGMLARCDSPSNYCPNPGIPIRGSKNSSDYNLGSRVRFSCQAYGGSKDIQVGSEVRECLPDHTWSGTETKCLGPYDYDNRANVRDALTAKLSEMAEEQKLELQKYREVQHSMFLNGSVPRGRMLDLNYPGRIIMYFAFDVSGSVERHNFNRSIQFAKAIVKRVGISEDGSRAGALTFSSKATPIFLPLNYESTSDVLDALDKINYTGGGTAASPAFSLIRQEFMPLVEGNLGKQNVKSVIFLLTDGKANMGGNPTVEAEILKEAGVEIYCIGITGDVRKKTLYDLASTSKNAKGEEYPNVYILQDYSALTWLVQEITNGTIDYSKCGLGLENVGNKVSQGRIVGGAITREPWPWMAALYRLTSKGDQYEMMCGGTIIHRHFILTAAHCMYREKGQGQEMVRQKLTAKELLIKLGLTDTKNEKLVEEREVLKIHIHKDYVPGFFYNNDIALLQIEPPIIYSPLIRPICLPPRELAADSPLYRADELAWATGWGHEGKLAEGDNRVKMSDILKEIELPIQSRERCLRSLGKRRQSFFTDLMLCAGDGRGENDTCLGDSGGPLMQRQLNPDGHQNLYWTQVGIVSWGYGCGQKNSYGYYTHVQKFVPWIKDTIRNAIKYGK